LLLAVLRIALVLLLMLIWFQRSLIYHPTTAAELPAKDSAVTHAIVDVSVTSHDNLTLNGWLTFSGHKRSETPPDVPSVLAQGRPLVIVFPGNAGNRARREYLLTAIGAMGADTMIFDYRGYGDNRGSPTEASFRRDARTIWKYATEDLRVPAGRIVLYGESLGGGTATRLASDLGAEGIEPGGLVLQSTFNSLVDAGQYHFPYLPVSLILIDRFESQKHIRSVQCPILQLHGQRDEIVPLALGEKLFNAAPQNSAGGIPKQQVLLPKANHNDVYFIEPQRVAGALRSFLNNVQQRAR
jgi:fermentation-respiration switch protein FrsA (DUF1100 family)